jgi:hypothetical protein
MEMSKEYNLFFAVQTLNRDDVQAEIGNMSQRPEFSRLLDGLMSLVSFEYRFGTKLPEFDPYLITEKTIGNLRYLFRLDRAQLGDDAITLLNKVEDEFFNGYIKPLNMPILPKKDSLYYGHNPVLYKESDEADDQNIYTFYRASDRNDLGRDFLTEYARSLVDKVRPPYKDYSKEVSVHDVHVFLTQISLQRVRVKGVWFTGLMQSKEAFSGPVSKKDFCRWVDERRRGVACAGFYAAAAIIQNAMRVGFDQFEEEVVERYTDLLYCGMGKCNLYQVSGAVFTHGPFASAPLTPAEIRAIPYLFDHWKELFEYVDHNDGDHLESLIEKFRAAGFDYEVEYLEKRKA